MRAIRNLRYARPILFFSLVLGGIWLSGFFLLLVTTDTVSNPVTVGRVWVDRFRASGSTPQTGFKTTKQPRYTELCEALPHAAGELRDLDDRWGRVSLEMSVAHAGSGIRMRRALRRLINQEPFVSRARV